MIGQIISHYKIIEELGRGGMGVVYKAEDTKLRRTVALKFLPAELTRDPDAKQRFLHEARAAAALNHANIVTIHEINEHEGQIFIAMEYVEGRTLKEMISGSVGAYNHTPLPINDVIAIATQIANGLAAAHAKGIIHRDIKPANIFITADQTVKILDFGIAKLAGAQTKLTKTGSTMGTAAYMSPEQTSGKEVDPRTDIWSLGVILYEMLSGETPFQGEYMQAVVYSILNDEPKPLSTLRPEVPACLAGIAARALAKNPTDRFQNMKDLAANLKAAAEGTQPIKARTKGFGTNIFSKKILYLSAAAAALAILLGLNVGGVRKLLFGPGTASFQAVRLAVLPFVNLSGDPQQEYFSDGLTQEMISQLGKLHPQSLNVIARTSVMRYKNSNAPIDQIGRELEVGYVLEGSVQREAGRVRVTANLIQVKGQAQLWADTYEREIAGILVLQSDVARKVAGALALKLLPSEKAQLANVRTINPEAYDAYLKGSQHWIKMTKVDLDTAQWYFELALQKDPNYAAVYAGLSLVWACRNQFGFASPAEAVPKIKAAALKAIELDDNIAEAHFALAGLKSWHDWDLAAAGPEWEKTVQLNPNFADGLAAYSHYLMIEGRPQEGMTMIERAVKLDPYNVMVISFYAMDLYFVRRYDEAIVQARKALELQPGNLVALSTLFLACATKGMEKEALAAVKEYIKTYGVPDVDATLDRGFAKAGFQGAMKCAAYGLAVLASEGLALPADVSILYLIAGDKDQALKWIERAYDIRDPNMPYLGMPIYDPIRSEPRFQRIFKLMKLSKSDQK
ncbi:MAG: protein kinase [Candidatus Aminicenantes bacterium]|nr:protein kinase [Candidatus Aminicenantes bacterium]